MGTWLLSADLLARSRFVVSRLTETVAALTILSNHQSPSTPWQRAFHAQHYAAYAEMLAEEDARLPVVQRLWRPRRGSVPGWIADFICLPPLGPDAAFEDELAQLSLWDAGRVRTELATLTGQELPPELEGVDIRTVVSDILRWTWTATVDVPENEKGER